MNRKEAGRGSSIKPVGRFCDKSSSRKKERNVRSSVSARLFEAEMYLPVHINDIKTNVLIDSGATASLISVDVYEKID